MPDNSIDLTHQNMRIVMYGGARHVCEVHVDKENGSVSVIVAPGLARIAEALAWKVGEELGWKMCAGGSYYYGSFGSHSSTINLETGNGRFYCRQLAKIW